MTSCCDQVSSLVPLMPTHTSPILTDCGQAGLWSTSSIEHSQGALSNQQFVDSVTVQITLRQEASLSCNVLWSYSFQHTTEGGEKCDAIYNGEDSVRHLSPGKQLKSKLCDVYSGHRVREWAGDEGGRADCLLERWVFPKRADCSCSRDSSCSRLCAWAQQDTLVLASS